MSLADVAISAPPYTGTSEAQDTAQTALLRRRLGVLNEDELAAMLGVKRSTLQRWRVDGKGPSYSKPSAGSILYREEDVAAWLAQRVEQTPEMKFGG